jgi:hypothetical protein
MLHLVHGRYRSSSAAPSERSVTRSGTGLRLVSAGETARPPLPTAPQLRTGRNGAAKAGETEALRYNNSFPSENGVSVAALTRKDLKTDRFAQEVGHTVEYVGEHRRQIVRYGAAALAVILLATALYFYRQRQHTARQQELAEAIRIQEAPVGGGSPGTPLSFPTQQAKEQTALKAFTDLSTKYAGTREGDAALYFRGAIQADKGNLTDAEKLFKQVADDGDKGVASLAKLALADIYFITNRPKESEKLLRGLMENPTVYVSKEQATYALARGIAPANPGEAKKLLEPLRTSRSAVSQAAIQLYAELAAR